MFELDLAQAVFVAGCAFFSGIISKEFITVPLLMAVVFREYPVTAAFTGLIVSLLLGSLTLFIKSGR